MSKSTKYSLDDWIAFLNRFYKGESLTALAKEAEYGLPFFTTKLKRVATDLDELDKYLSTVKQQHITRNNGVSRQTEVRNYINNAFNALTEWKQIPEFEHYEVSDTGLVRNQNGQLLTVSITKRNFTSYARVSLSKDGKKFYFQVHQLVMKAFKPIDNDKLQVDHLDNNGLNNNIANLEWVSASENIKQSFTRNTNKKLSICSAGGKKGGKTMQDKAVARLNTLLGNRFKGLHNGIVTFICENCNQAFTVGITSKCLRNGWKGVCTPCKRVITKQRRLHAKSA